MILTLTYQSILQSKKMGTEKERKHSFNQGYLKAKINKGTMTKENRKKVLSHSKSEVITESNINY